MTNAHIPSIRMSATLTGGYAVPTGLDPWVREVLYDLEDTIATRSPTEVHVEEFRIVVRAEDTHSAETVVNYLAERFDQRPQVRRAERRISLFVTLL
jgi:hypothetical protein